MKLKSNQAKATSEQVVTVSLEKLIHLSQTI